MRQVSGGVLQGKGAEKWGRTAVVFWGGGFSSAASRAGVQVLRGNDGRKRQELIRKERRDTSRFVSFSAETMR